MYNVMYIGSSGIGNNDTTAHIMYDCDGYNRTGTDVQFVSTVGGANRMELLFRHSGSRCLYSNIIQCHNYMYVQYNA